MAVRIRLLRTGKTKQPSYRVVAKEARTPRSGDYIELLGTYNPLTEPASVRLDEERLKHWLSVGAQPTETVARLIKSNSGIELAAKKGNPKAAVKTAPAAAPATTAEKA